MRVLFDILGSTERSGGMRLHSTELVSAWLSRYPDDQVLILGGRWAKNEARFRRARVICWPNEAAVLRATGQLLAEPAVALLTGADFVVSLSPIVSPLVPRRRALCFQHDWRHKKNPHEFPTAQRWYRLLWELSAKSAGMNICISEKAAAETSEHAPGAQTVVVPNGRDHARSWTAVRGSMVGDGLVTFGHHNNKRPELVIAALRSLRSRGAEVPRLAVLGTPPAYGATLREFAEAQGVQEYVTILGFVSNEEYQSRITNASAVLLVSSDEGFGLPVAEAEYLGVPAIITDDSGMESIFGDFAIVAEATPDAVADAIVAAVSSTAARGEELPARGGRGVTWAETAAGVRALMDGRHRPAGSRAQRGSDA